MLITESAHIRVDATTVLLLIDRVIATRVPGVFIAVRLLHTRCGMTRSWRTAVVLGLLFALPVAASTSVLNKELFFVTEPLMDDGTPDYARYVNDRLGAGVTPDENTVVLLVPVLGIELGRAERERLGLGASDGDGGPRVLRRSPPRPYRLCTCAGGARGGPSRDVDPSRL